MRLGFVMVVYRFLLKGAFLFERMLDCCVFMWPLTVASEIEGYLVTWFTVNPGQDLIKPFLISLRQVEIVGENKALW